MIFYPKTQKYKFSNLPQNNRSKRRSTHVDHVSEVRFEIRSLDLRRFEKSLKTVLLSSLFLSFFFFFGFLLSQRRAMRPSLFFFLYFVCIFNKFKLTSISYLPKFLYFNYYKIFRTT
jgi:hypothetical protein